jgi:acyl-CoA thioesterase-1
MAMVETDDPDSAAGLWGAGRESGVGSDLGSGEGGRGSARRPCGRFGGSVLIAFLGDSLSAGMGVEEDEAFPMILQERLRELGWSVEVLNAGVSGDTTAGGVSRLNWILSQDPQIVVVELGANDGLRGMSVDKTEANLRQMIVRAEEAGARVLLAGMMVPPNYGAEYAERFNAVFPSLAAELDVELVPFLLSSVAAVPELNLADGIHPNPAGHLRVAETVLPHLDAMLEDLAVSDSPPAP